MFDIQTIIYAIMTMATGEKQYRIQLVFQKKTMAIAPIGAIERLFAEHGFEHSVGTGSAWSDSFLLDSDCEEDFVKSLCAACEDLVTLGIFTNMPTIRGECGDC